MLALFVHGMGRSPLSGWPMLWRLRRAGLRVGSFGYVASVEDFAVIKKRLTLKLLALAEGEDYVLIGHSLGGVLIRAAINAMPPGVKRPVHIFLLGSPQRPVLLAQRFRGNRLYRALTRDCGQLLGSEARMSEVAPVSVTTTSIAGVRGPKSKRAPFFGELNDGVVTVSEVGAEWIGDQVQVPVIHTFLPMSKRVTEIILARLASDV